MIFRLPLFFLVVVSQAAMLSGCGGASSNAVPSASGAEFSLTEDSRVFSERVFASDPHATSLRFRIVRSASHGTAQMNDVGEFEYIPQPDFFGTDSFTFTASNGKAESPPATVKLSVTAVPDAPRFMTLGPRASDPDQYPTLIPLTVVDPDGDRIVVEVESDDPAVAQVETDPVSTTVIVRPLTEGTAGITVKVSDGTFVISEKLEFSSVPMETTRRLDVDAPNETAIVLTNVADIDVTFQLDVNGRMFPGSRPESLSRIMKSSRFMQSFTTMQADPALAIWKAIAENTRRGATFTEQTWVHGPVRLLNSLGFGYCDDVASAFAFLAAEAGLEARVWTLNGHVVPEVFVEGRWQVYDVDIGVIYHNTEGEIAGVEELAANPTLITNPIDPILAEKMDSRSPFVQEVADIYATVGDNLVYDHYTQPVQLTDSTITLPAGGSFTLGGYWSEPLIDVPTGRVIPFAAQGRLTFPAGWVGKLPTAFVLVGLEGQGKFKLNDVEYEIGSAELAARLADLDTAQIDPELVESRGQIMVAVLINSLAAAFESSNRVMLSGLNVGAISLSTAQLPEAERLNVAVYGE